MARVEKNAELEERLQDVKGDVVREIRRRTRVHRPWFTCCLLLLAVLVGVGVWIAWTVAATGLVQVPVFSSLAYGMPSPLRPVTPGVPVETVLGETFTSTLTRRLYEGGGTLENRSIDVHLSESSLTASVRTFLERAGIDWIDGSQAQIAIEPDAGVELFVPLRVRDRQTSATLRFQLEAVDGNLVITPTQVAIGSARVPRFLIAIFLKPLLEAELGKLNEAMVGYAKISKIEVLPRELSITGELSVEIQSSL